MNTSPHLDNNSHPLNLEKIQKVFPRSAATFVAIFEHGATATMKDLADDPVAGREWMKKYYSLLKKLELTLVPELMELMKMNDSHGVTMEYRAEIMKSISIQLRESLRCGPNDIVGEHGDEITRFIKGSLHRSIKLKWFAECLKDRRYRPAVLSRCERVRNALSKAISEGDSITAQMVNVMNEPEAYLLMMQDYLEKFDLTAPENTRLAITTLRSMSTDLMADIGEHQAYEVADSYTVVRDLTKEPILVTMGSCSVAPIFGWEGRAIGLASMRSQAYEDLFRSGELSVDAFKSLDVIRKKTHEMLQTSAEDAARLDEKMDEDRDQENDIGTAMLANSASIPYIVTWEGRVKIPESTVELGELFSALLNGNEKGEYLSEALRFQLLWYLRALTCRSEMQPKDASPSKIIKTVHKPKQIPSTLRLKMLPRDPRPSRAVESTETNENPEDGHGLNGQPRKSPIPHVRKLPKGFYATPNAIAEARKRDIKLAEEVQEDGT
ncbi:hypothetical protein KAZ92_02155, partial [Candidatus Gracilibacteria bacterium]|nr:hypothetical protein [Candidatus Gracilibacteria bacterium]